MRPDWALAPGRLASRPHRSFTAAMHRRAPTSPRGGAAVSPMSGSKANPRVPAARKIPRLGKFVEKGLPDGTRRVLEHQDFATDAVVAQLEAAGWKRRQARNRRPLTELDEIGDLHDLSNDIRHVVADYISKALCQIEPKKFRLGAKKFHKWIAGAKAAFPDPGAALAEALNDEIEKLDHEDVPDIEHCRTVVRVLREVAERVQVDESGRGADADRAKHEFFLGLAAIFEERTGRRPTRVFDPIKGKPTGPFFEFVTAVNKKIPKSLRLTGSYIDRLTRAHFPSN